MEIVGCPGCGAPAEVEDWSTLGGTSGPVDHVKTLCTERHWFLLPRDMLRSRVPADLRDIPSSGQV